MKLIADIKLAASIAFTHMRAKLKQTIIATGGVTIGITVFIFMLSFIRGTNNFMKDITFEQSPHLRLFNEVQLTQESILDKTDTASINFVAHEKPKDILISLKDGRQAVEELRRDPAILAVSGSANTRVFYRVGGNTINGTVNGISFEDEHTLFNLGNKLVDGSFSELNIMPNSMVMGVGLAKKLNVKTGDKVNVITEKGDNYLITIIGIFKTGLTDIDKLQSFASLNTVQRFLHVPLSYITDIKIKLYDMEQAPEFSTRLQHKYGYMGSDWKKDNTALLDGEVLRNISVYGVAGTILLVAGFGIFNILTMMIYEKMKDIAILKAMGFADKDVRWIFLIQALAIGFVGALFGLVFGFLLSYATSKAPFESDVMITMDHLPVSFETMYYVIGFTFGILTTALSGYLPSRKAAKLDPITILRG